MDIIINSYGATLRRANGCFHITTEDEEHTQIAACDIERIELSRGTMITTDAIMLAMENDINIVFTEHSGQPMGRVCSNMSSTAAGIRRGQLVFYYTSDAVKWTKSNIIDKVLAQSHLLDRMKQDISDDETKTLTEKSIRKINWLVRKIRHVDESRITEVASELRGLEGWAARVYFEAYSNLLPETLRFEKRSQHPAHDCINALLNYGYSFLCKRVEDAAFKVGLDTTMGVLHNNKHIGSRYLTYDLMEKYRVWVDETIWTLVREGVIGADSCIISNDRTATLTERARHAFSDTFYEYMNRVRTFKSDNHTNMTEIFREVQAFAQKMKSYENVSIA